MRVREYTQEIWFTKPKLEVGQVATDYRPKRIISEPVARTSTWEAGKQYYQGKVGEPYLDIVAKYNRWYRCLVTHVSKNDNMPADGSSTEHWEKSDRLSFVATDLLLADQGVLNLLFSQKILMKDSNNNLTASINADENGSYCIYYPSGNKMMEFSSEGFIYFYNDNATHTLAWKLGHGGNIALGDTDDWIDFYLCDISSVHEHLVLNENTRFDRTKYYKFHSSTGGNWSQYDDKIFINNTGNPATATVIPDGWYTPNDRAKGARSENGTLYTIMVYHIADGFIDSKTLVHSV